MSSYLVDKETIDIVVAVARRLELTTGFTYFSHGTLPLKNIGQRLWDMNADAVRQRYNDDTQAPHYRYTKPELPSTLKETLIKSYCETDKLLYQCKQGNVYESKEYKELRQLKEQIADYLIRLMKEYEGMNF